MRNNYIINRTITYRTDISNKEIKELENNVKTELKSINDKLWFEVFNNNGEGNFYGKYGNYENCKKDNGGVINLCIGYGKTAVIECNIEYNSYNDKITSFSIKKSICFIDENIVYDNQYREIDYKIQKIFDKDGNKLDKIIEKIVMKLEDCELDNYENNIERI